MYRWLIVFFLVPGQAQAIHFSTRSCAADPAVARVTQNNGVTEEACSGVFVSPNVMLTAAHCVRGSTTVMVRGDSGRVRVHPGFVSSTATPALDVAVVVFPESVRHRFAVLARTPAPVGARIRVAGFGERSSRWDGAASTSCLSGFNRVRMHELGRYTIASPATFAGVERAIPAVGDSGGPLLTEDGRVLGISNQSQDGTVMMGEHRSYLGSFVDLQAPAVREWWVGLGLGIRDAEGTPSPAARLGDPAGESAGAL